MADLVTGRVPGPRQVLLLLDNCEHLIDGCAALAGELLRGCPQLRILATSRQPFGVSGENILLVPSLAMPRLDGPPPTPKALEQYEAVTLFVERATAAVPTFAVTEQNCAAVAALCRGLDGIPLALELAAVRLRALSPEEILDRLSSRYGLLTRGDPTAPARQQTLRASMDWSCELCSAQERIAVGPARRVHRRLRARRGGRRLLGRGASARRRPGRRRVLGGQVRPGAGGVRGARPVPHARDDPAVRPGDARATGRGGRLATPPS